MWLLIVYLGGIPLATGMYYTSAKRLKDSWDVKLIALCAVVVLWPVVILYTIGTYLGAYLSGLLKGRP